MQAALQELGFNKCYHMTEVMKHPSHAQFWHDVMMEKSVDWHEFFRDYQATVDWPGCTYYKQLMDLYPDAKVLLSVRDPERWYESTRDTIYRIPQSLLMTILKVFVPHLRIMYPVVNGIVWRDTFEGRFEDRTHAIAIFNQHNEAVEQYVPAERLLVYDVKEGWEPLCRFRDVDVPVDKPFPHLNDKALMQQAMRWGPAAIFAAIGGLIALLVWLIITFVG